MGLVNPSNYFLEFFDNLSIVAFNSSILPSLFPLVFTSIFMETSSIIPSALLAENFPDSNSSLVANLSPVGVFTVNW
jgi:hypothetical protein